MPAHQPPMMVAILFASAGPFDAAAIGRAHQALGDDIEPLEDIVLTDPQTLSVRVDRDEFVAAMMPVPLPHLAQSIAAARRWWPDAASALRTHRQHVIVAPIRRTEHGSHPGNVLMARRLTRVAAAIAMATPGALGAECAWSGILRDPADLRDAARDNWPLAFWLEMRPFGTGIGGDRQRGVAVRGLMPFIGRDLQLRPTDRMELPELVSRASAFSEYLLEHGPVLLHGQTAGVSAGEFFRIEHADDPHTGTKLILMNLEQRGH
jgi:hypothetical protein